MKQFTIGYIRHNKYVYETYLGPSIDNLQGEFDLISTSDENKPATNYNELISKCNTPYPRDIQKDGNSVYNNCRNLYFHKCLQ